MPHWSEYLAETAELTGLFHLSVHRTIPKAWATTPGTIVHRSEIKRIYNACRASNAYSYMFSDLTIGGKICKVDQSSSRNSRIYAVRQTETPQETVCILFDKPYVLVGMCSSDNRDICMQVLDDLNAHLKHLKARSANGNHLSPTIANDNHNQTVTTNYTTNTDVNPSQTGAQLPYTTTTREGYLRVYDNNFRRRQDDTIAANNTDTDVPTMARYLDVL